MTAASQTSAALLRQDARRAHNVPTVGALVGPVGLSARAWREWTRTQHRACAVASDTHANRHLTELVATAYATTPPINRAVALLVAITGRAHESLAHDVGRMTQYDLDVLRRSLPLDSTEPGPTAALLALADRARGVEPDPAHFVRELGDASRVVRAIAALYPAESRLALLIVPPTGTSADTLLSTARALELIVTAEPRLPVAIALATEDFAALTARHADVRAVALLREGFVEVRGVSGNELSANLRTAGIEPVSASVARLSADGVAEEVATAFVAASRAVRNPTAEDIESDFRSVHEAFLFGQLESMPQTAGLFRPNHPLGFRHGHATAEGDLVAEALKLAVEVDGGFYHLNPHQYRRDRRKDWLYQQNGYLVLRFLAEDVVSELELVLDTILEAVALRRASVPPIGAA